MTAAPPEAPADVLIMPWERFVTWWRAQWHQGEHVGIVGPTGSGKSTLTAGLCSVRDYVMALNIVDDNTLDGTGWERRTKWPLPIKDRDRIKDGKPLRIIVGKHVRKRADREANRLMLSRVMPDLWEHGNWTVVVGELQLLADRRFYNLADDAVEMMIAARKRGLSVVAELQRVAIGQSTGGASSTVGDQVTWLAVAYTRDDRMVQRLAELLGRPAAEVRELVRALPPYTWAIVGRDPRAPYVVTSPPEVVVPHPSAEQAPAPSWRELVWGRLAG